MRATAGVDQGCPLSPAFFAIGIADFLGNIHERLRQLNPRPWGFSYLDDIVVVVPVDQSDAALRVVLEELRNARLEVNEGKTIAWTWEPGTHLPARVSVLHKATVEFLGACVSWLDPEGPLARVPMRSGADGASAVQ
jgi:hypothetical protein